MKSNGDIQSFFQNYEAAKRRKVAAEEQHEDIVSNIEDEAVHSPPPVHSAEIEFDIEDEAVHSNAEIESHSEDEAVHSPCARPYNIQRLPPDPGERIPISEYDVDDQDEVRRRYIAKQAVQPYAHNFQVRKIYVPLWEDIYEPNRRSRRYYEVQTNDDRYRREVYLGVIDQTIQQLDNRFDEVNTELLICMSALNPLNSFASYDALKVMRLAEFYPMDISSTYLIRLEFQLTNFIDDMRQDDRFRNASNIGELSIMLVATKKHVLYGLVYLLIKLILILPVATASVERVFSAMNLVKNKLRTTMSDDRLNDCLVTFIERDVFMEVSEDDIVDTFMAMQKRRVT
ncbi:hypothetical protein VPH35_120661 [Triticum aestivum]